MSREIRAAAEANLGATLRAKVYYDSGTAMVQRGSEVSMTEQPTGSGSGLYVGDAVSGQLPTDEIILEISGVPSGGGTYVPAANIEAISNDEDAADNLEATYDGTGYVNGVAPATQDQLGNIANTGAAINKVVGGIDGSIIGVETNTYLSAQALDGTYHEIEQSGNEISVVYTFDIGTTGIPVSVTLSGRLYDPPPIVDSLIVEAWDWNTGWTQIGTEDGVNSSVDAAHTFILFASHVGTGINVGEVRIRFSNTGLGAGTVLFTDLLYVSYAVQASQVGYANGAVWVDTEKGNTGTTNFINGTADNPVKTWGEALTIADSMGLSRFQIINGSTIELTGDSSHFSIFGVEYSLLLAGQTIDGMYVSGALVLGTGVGSAFRFEDCKIGTVTLGPGGFKHCGIGVSSGQFTAGAIGQFIFSNCFSLVPGSDSPVFNFDGLGGDVGINNRGWKGGAEYSLDWDCTLSHEILAGGGTTVTTGGADVEIRGITRSVVLIVTGTGGLCQFVGTTGPITVTGDNVTCEVNLYGVSASLSGTTTATVNDETVNPVDIAAIAGDVTIIAGDVAGLDGASMRGNDNANEIPPLNALGIRTAIGMAAADLDAQLAAIALATGSTPEEFVNELKASTGWTVGDTWTFDKVMKILIAWSAGHWQDEGTTGVYEVLDAEDDTTPVLNIIASENTPQKIVSDEI